MMLFQSAYCTMGKFLHYGLQGGKPVLDVRQNCKNVQFQKNFFCLSEVPTNSKEHFKAPHNFSLLYENFGKLRKTEKISNSAIFQNGPVSSPLCTIACQTMTQHARQLNLDLLGT